MADEDTSLTTGRGKEAGPLVFAGAVAAVTALGAAAAYRHEVRRIRLESTDRAAKYLAILDIGEDVVQGDEKQFLLNELGKYWLAEPSRRSEYVRMAMQEERAEEYLSGSLQDSERGTIEAISSNIQQVRHNISQVGDAIRDAVGSKAGEKLGKANIKLESSIGLAKATELRQFAGAIGPFFAELDRNPIMPNERMIAYSAIMHRAAGQFKQQRAQRS